MPVLQDGCMLQRIFDGTLKTNKTKVDVKAVWQKHATELSQYGFWICCTTDCGYPKCITSTCNRQSEPLYLKTIQLVCKSKNQDLIWMSLPQKRVIHGFIYFVFLGY